MLPVGLDSVLAAQALFPLVGAAEMGCTGLSGDQSLDSVTQWGNITSRVLQRADYVNMLGLAYPQLAKGQYTIAHVANAIAAFEAVKWRADNSAFDRFLKGDRAALTPKQKQGATYFLGKGQCASCHAGPLLTDHGHHAIGVPQFGPGNGDGIGGHEDFGYGRTTGRDEDAFKFRTPSLRNVAVTAPYGHNGAYATLKEMVYHYTRPQVPRWNLGQVHLAPGYQAQPIAGAWDDAASRANIAARSEVKAIPLSAQEVDALVDFLYSLTDAEIGRVNDARR
jgi:cytochrome c peroxidase